MFASPNTLELEESAPTAHLDTTMIATLTNAFANLATSKLEDSVNQCAVVIKPTSMESVSATMVTSSLMANALVSTDAH